MQYQEIHGFDHRRPVDRRGRPSTGTVFGDGRGESEESTGDGLLDSFDEFLEANRSLQRALWASEAYMARLRAGERMVDIACAEPVGTAAPRTTKLWNALLGHASAVRDR